MEKGNDCSVFVMFIRNAAEGSSCFREIEMKVKCWKLDMFAH